MTSQQPRGSTPVERWVQHVVQAISVASIIGGVVLLSDLRTTVAVMTSEMKGLSKRFEEMRSASADRYTATQAERDLDSIRQRLIDHEKRLRKAEENMMRLIDR